MSSPGPVRLWIVGRTANRLPAVLDDLLRQAQAARFRRRRSRVD